MNSKAEFNRCHIPRLQLEEEEQEGAREREEQVLARQMEEELIENMEEWESQRTRDKARELRSKLGGRKGAVTRRGAWEPPMYTKEPKKRRLEYAILEEWPRRAICDHHCPRN